MGVGGAAQPKKAATGPVTPAAVWDLESGTDS